MTEPSQQLCVEKMKELNYSVTHHLVPKLVGPHHIQVMTCIYCDKTEREIREQSGA